MQKLAIRGEKRLSGEITLQGAKNSALALLAGCALCSGEVRLKNCPALSDVFAACRILNNVPTMSIVSALMQEIWIAVRCRMS